MSYLDWKVGDRVVCVQEPDAARYRAMGGYQARCQYPVKDGIYTIRAMYHCEGKVGILLAEIVNPKGVRSIGVDGETGFYAARFRKVEPRKTDISIFTAMLHDQRQKVPA